MHRVRPQENGFLETGRPLLARFWALTPTDMHSSTCLRRACIYVYENVLLVSACASRVFVSVSGVRGASEEDSERENGLQAFRST